MAPICPPHPPIPTLLLFLCDWDLGQKAERKWSALLDSYPTEGTRRTHGHLELSFVSTWEPSALCSLFWSIREWRNKQGRWSRNQQRALNCSEKKIIFAAENVITMETHYLCHVPSSLTCFHSWSNVTNLKKKRLTQLETTSCTSQYPQIDRRWRHFSINVTAVFAVWTAPPRRSSAEGTNCSNILRVKENNFTPFLQSHRRSWCSSEKGKGDTVKI